MLAQLISILDCIFEEYEDSLIYHVLKYIFMLTLIGLLMYFQYE